MPEAKKDILYKDQYLKAMVHALVEHYQPVQIYSLEFLITIVKILK